MARACSSAICALVMAGASAMAGTVAADVPAPDLAGVWQAERNFGPDVRGPLMIEQRGQEWTATIDGRTASIHIDNDKVWFALAGGEGSFRGTFAQKGSVMTGLWTQPP